MALEVNVSPSDEVLREKLDLLLLDSDLSITTFNGLYSALEASFAPADISPRRDFLRDCFTSFIQRMANFNASAKSIDNHQCKEVPEPPSVDSPPVKKRSSERTLPSL